MTTGHLLLHGLEQNETTPALSCHLKRGLLERSFLDVMCVLSFNTTGLVGTHGDVGRGIHQFKQRIA